MRKALSTLFIISLSMTSFFIKGQNISIAASKLNILYFGVANPLEVVVENMKCGTFFLTTDNGKLKKNKCSYEIYPEKLGKAKIFVKKLKGKDTITIGIKEFRVKKIPSPTARVGGQSYGLISKNLLKACGGIAAQFDDFDISMNLAITNFTINIIRGKDTTFIQRVDSNKFTKEIYSEFVKLKQFDMVNFVDIYYNAPYEILNLDVATGEYVIDEKTQKVKLNDIKLIIED